MLTIFKAPLSSLLLIIIMLSGCSTPPFSYADDRCLGSYNQCRLTCVDAGAGAQTACYDRCLTRETQCYAVGDDRTGSSLSQDRLIDDLQSEAAKQAQFEEWQRQKQRDAEETGTSDEDIVIEVLEE